MNVLSNLFGSMTQIWLNVAFIICVFTVLAFRPQCIKNQSLFKTGIILFAISLVVPAISLLLPTPGLDALRAPRTNDYEIIGKIVNFLGVLLFAGALVSSLMAVMPKPGAADVDAS